MNSFVQGMRAYRSAEHTKAVALLAPLAAGKGLTSRLASYYCGLSHREMGLEDLRAGRYSQAGGHFRQAIALIGNRADLAEYLLVVYARTGQHERCAVEAEQVARSRPGDLDAQIRLAQSQWRSGQRPPQSKVDVVRTIFRPLSDLLIPLLLIYRSQPGQAGNEN